MVVSRRKNRAIDINNIEFSLNEDGGSNDVQVFEDKSSYTDANNNDTMDILHGRRIIELDHFAKMMKQGCVSCKEPLQLASCVSERKYGLASLFYIKCCICGDINCVASGKRQNDEKNGQGPLNVNAKLGVALLHAGVGEATIATIFALLNIPCITPRNMKKAERRAGCAIESLAKESCDVTLKNEIEKSSDSLSLSFDAGWQKRGSGKNYSSLSGHASMIGLTTKKVVGFNVMNKTCKKCDLAAKTDKIVIDHDCRKNWGGSSKAMEPAMAVDILNNIKENGHNIQKIIMDDDATTISKIRREVDSSVEKCSDRNHTVKNFTNTLYALQKDKIIQKSLSSTTISHIKKCFTYALSSNRNNPIGMKTNLLAIPHHLFGDHQQCEISWCRFLQSPNTYVPKNLPFGKYLQNEDLFNSLLKVFTQYSEIAQKLSSLESTQINENFNQLVSTKNPKNKFYSSSESTSHRVAAAVCQKNMGEEYIVKANERLFLSPGKQTAAYIERKNRKRQREENLKTTPSFKKRRVNLKMKQKKKVTTLELREGLTYQTAVDVTDYPAESIHEIPPPPLPIHQLPLPAKCYTRVYFDLETTGLGIADITQIYAVCGESSFSMYVKPEVPITAKASKITGLTFDGMSMFYHGKPVVCHSLQHVLENFGRWLASFEDPVLFAHNCRKFDGLVLCSAMQKVPIVKLHERFRGFCDTLEFFRAILPFFERFSLEYLVTHVLKISYNAHDALEDSKVLQRLTELPQHAIEEHYLNYSFDATSTFKIVSLQSQVKQNFETTCCTQYNF